jgi:hypothetical protein
VLAIASAGLLWGAERTRPTASQKAAKAKPAAKAASKKAPAKPAAGKQAAPRPAEKQPAAPQVAPAAAQPRVPSGGIEIISPESGAKIRGVAPVRVSWGEPAGYVIFRVDGEFAYASASPFEMRWDTSTAADGEHVITADAYDAHADYQGTSSLKIMVENAIPTPPEGVLLQVRFKENDVLTRRFQAKSELSALTANQALPPGFDVLASDMDAELSQSVMDTLYEGNSSLVRNRLREGDVTVAGTQRQLPEVGQYAMVQISRNGLALPAAAAVSRPRLGLGEISLAMPDYPVFPGDEWESPLGAVSDLYTRRAIFVQARHTFEGLRWFRERECAVITSSYSLPSLTLYKPAAGTASVAPAARYRSSGEAWSSTLSRSPQFTVGLTQGRMGGGGRMGAARRGGAGAGGAARRQGGAAAGRTTAPGAQPGARQGAAPALESVTLLDLKGTRRMFLTRASGRIIHTEDTILGKVEFRAVGQQASAGDLAPYSVALTQMRGGRAGGMGGRGMAGRGMGGRGTGRTGGAARQGARAATPAGRAQTPGAQPAAKEIPPELLYGVRLTGDLIIK